MTDKVTVPELRNIVKTALAEDEVLLSTINSLKQWADAQAGKMLTKRNTPEGWIVRREYGMTQLETDAYYHARYTQTEPAGAKATLLVAHQEVNVYLPEAGAWSDLTMWHDRAVRDIAARKALLADGAHLRRIAKTLNDVNAALQAVTQELPRSPGTVPDRYAMIRAARLGDMRVDGRLCL